MRCNVVKMVFHEKKGEKIQSSTKKTTRLADMQHGRSTQCDSFFFKLVFKQNPNKIPEFERIKVMMKRRAKKL